MALNFLDTAIMCLQIGGKSRDVHSPVVVELYYKIELLHELPL